MLGTPGSSVNSGRLRGSGGGASPQRPCHRCTCTAPKMPMLYRRNHASSPERIERWRPMPYCSGGSITGWSATLSSSRTVSHGSRPCRAPTGRALRCAQCPTSVCLSGRHRPHPVIPSPPGGDAEWCRRVLTRPRRIDGRKQRPFGCARDDGTRHVSHTAAAR